MSHNDSVWCEACNMPCADLHEYFTQDQRYVALPRITHPSKLAVCITQHNRSTMNIFHWLLLSEAKFSVEILEERFSRVTLLSRLLPAQEINVCFQSIWQRPSPYAWNVDVVPEQSQSNRSAAAPQKSSTFVLSWYNGVNSVLATY